MIPFNRDSNMMANSVTNPFSSTPMQSQNCMGMAAQQYGQQQMQPQQAPMYPYTSGGITDYGPQPMQNQQAYGVANTNPSPIMSDSNIPQSSYQPDMGGSDANRQPSYAQGGSITAATNPTTMEQLAEYLRQYYDQEQEDSEEVPHYKIGGFLKKIAKPIIRIGLPVAGGIIAGPVGAGIGGFAGAGLTGGNPIAGAALGAIGGLGAQALGATPLIGGSELGGAIAPGYASGIPSEAGTTLAGSYDYGSSLGGIASGLGGAVEVPYIDSGSTLPPGVNPGERWGHIPDEAFDANGKVLPPGVTNKGGIPAPISSYTPKGGVDRSLFPNRPATPGGQITTNPTPWANSLKIGAGTALGAGLVGNALSGGSGGGGAPTSNQQPWGNNTPTIAPPGTQTEGIDWAKVTRYAMDYGLPLATAAGILYGKMETPKENSEGLTNAARVFGPEQQYKPTLPIDRQMADLGEYPPLGGNAENFFVESNPRVKYAAQGGKIKFSKNTFNLGSAAQQVAPPVWRDDQQYRETLPSGLELMPFSHEDNYNPHGYERQYFVDSNPPTRYAARGGYLDGHTGGQDDKIKAMLSDGEYVVSADVVSSLGDGNNKAGAQKLDGLMANVRKHKYAKAAKTGKLPPKAKSLESYMRGR